MASRPRRQECDPATQPETPVAPAFPSARYFQIHFEQLYQLIHELKEKLDATTRELALLRARTGIEAERAKTAEKEPDLSADPGVAPINNTPHERG